MLQYVNAYSCSYNHDDKSVVLTFYQNEPRVSIDANDVSIEQHQLFSAVMSLSAAKLLIKSMQDIIDSE